MIEHSESEFYYPDEIKFYENREFTKLYGQQRIGTGHLVNKLVNQKIRKTARKKLKLSSMSKKSKAQQR